MQRSITPSVFAVVTESDGSALVLAFVFTAAMEAA
jgi:hypothetical protein